MIKITNELGSYNIKDEVFVDIIRQIMTNFKEFIPISKDFIHTSLIDKELKANIEVRVKKGTDLIKKCQELNDVIKDVINLMTGISCKTAIDIKGFSN